MVHSSWIDVCLLSSAADKKTAVGVVEGNLDEARELVSLCHLMTHVSLVLCDVHYSSGYMNSTFCFEGQLKHALADSANKCAYHTHARTHARMHAHTHTHTV